MTKTVSQKIVGMNGDEAVAFAAKQAQVDVVAAYPITPQTIIVERFSDYVANGEVDTQFVCVESEHSALSACVGSSLAGSRVFTATSSQGLALMHEVLYVASGLRTPIVMAVANRALSAPINIHNDHSDMMGSRDCGWIQIYAENAQESYDWTLQAFRIAEDHKVSLPVTVNLDGFTISHAMEGVSILEEDEVSRFVGKRTPMYKLDTANPMTFGALTLPDYYSEFKRQQVEAMQNAPPVITSVANEFNKFSGRQYSQVSGFNMSDADAAVVCMGSVAGTARTVAAKMRTQGKHVGVLKVWQYRPWPTQEVARALSKVKCVGVIDRAVSFGAPYGALCSDIASTKVLTGIQSKIFNVICGLGGRDVKPADIEGIFEKALRHAGGTPVDDPFAFVGVRP
ncbi:MAG: pyruvate ferredoxin oxidoreductase [Candidatus Bathyarchaeia archaeon]